MDRTLTGRLAAVCGWFLLRTALAQGGPPMLTDDTEVPPPGHWENNLGGVLTVLRQGAGYQAELPQADFNLGVTDHLYVKYESSWLLERAAGGPAQQGLGDSTFGFKWRFADQAPGGLSVSMYPKLTINSLASSYRRGLVDRNASVNLPLEFQRLCGPVQANLEIGYTAHERDPAASDYWNLGALVGRSLAPRLQGMAELYATTDRRLGQGNLVLNLGAAYHVSAAVALIGSGGLGILGADRPSALAYLGLQLTP